MTSTDTTSFDSSHAQAERAFADFNAAEATAPWLLCDRHPADAVAFRFVDESLAEESLTYGGLKERSQQIAAILAEQGIGTGDRVASLLGKGPDLPALVLGIWRLGAVYVPLFTAFASTIVADRIGDSGARVLVTDATQLFKTVGLSCTVMLANMSPGDEVPAGAVNISARADVAVTPIVETPGVGPAAPLVHMFTSGTTGKPKTVVHPLAYAAGWQSYLELGLAPGATFWCGADPGWAYGLYTALVAPMAAGVPSILTRGTFKPADTWRILRALNVTDFATAPTAYRALRAVDPGDDLPHLRGLSSAGEPLTPEVSEWTRRRFGVDVHDHFGQTELGMPAGFAHHADIRVAPVPRAMGRSLPGWSITILKATTDEIADTDEVGRLAVDVAASPFFTFTGYGVERDVHAARFTENAAYYLTGDLASVDDVGLVHFASRDDDVILMAGYRIGPFDIESVLLTHSAVSEVAIVAAPDDVRGEVIHAFVVPTPGTAVDDADAVSVLTRDLQDWVKQNYGAHAYPRKVTFVKTLPKTPSGKIQRAELRKQLVALAERDG